MGDTAKHTAIPAGIVLAAGNNERFKRHYGPQFVKQGLEINGQSLIVRTMNQLESLGCQSKDRIGTLSQMESWRECFESTTCG